MKLEDQCVSLELAKRLKELGIKQESIFVWEYYDDQCHALKFIPYAVIPSQINKFELYSAFTVGELGALLPDELSPDSGSGSRKKLFSWHTGSMWFTGYQCKNGMYLPVSVEPNEANARAKLLIFLIENGLIEVAENGRN